MAVTEHGVAFSPVDEAVHLLDDEGAPWSIQLEVRVEGRLDEERLREAFGRALAVHPMGRARRAPSTPGAHTDRWEIRPGCDVDPLRVIDAADDAAIAQAREELQGTAVPLVESPPLRARLVRGPDDDLLMLNANHAAMDAFGALRILRSVAAAYTDGPVLDTDGPDPIAARRHLDDLSRADGPTRSRRRLALVDKLTDVVVPPARVAADAGTGTTGYGFHHQRLPPPLSQAVVEFQHPGTVNDVLLAALHLSIADWNARHGQRSRRIGVLVPANLRPPGWRHDVVGNFSLPARVTTSRRDRRQPGSTLHALTSQTRRRRPSASALSSSSSSAAPTAYRCGRSTPWSPHSPLPETGWSTPPCSPTSAISRTPRRSDPTPAAPPKRGSHPRPACPSGSPSAPSPSTAASTWPSATTTSCSTPPPPADSRTPLSPASSRLVRPHTAEIDSLLTQAANTG